MAPMRAMNDRTLTTGEENDISFLEVVADESDPDWRVWVDVITEETVLG